MADEALLVLQIRFFFSIHFDLFLCHAQRVVVGHAKPIPLAMFLSWIMSHCLALGRLFEEKIKVLCNQELTQTMT